MLFSAVYVIPCGRRFGGFHVFAGVYLKHRLLLQYVGFYSLFKTVFRVFSLLWQLDHCHKIVKVIAAPSDIKKSKPGDGVGTAYLEFASPGANVMFQLCFEYPPATVTCFRANGVGKKSGMVSTCIQNLNADAVLQNGRANVPHPLFLVSWMCEFVSVLRIQINVG